MSLISWLDQPIPIGLSDGIPLAEFRVNANETHLAAIDTGSPFTGLSAESVLGISAPPTLREIELSIVDHYAPDVTRFIFHRLQTYDVPELRLGLGNPVSAQGIIGTSLLASFSIRLVYGVDPYIVFADRIPDDRIQLATECDRGDLATADFGARCTAEFLTPPQGGGAIRIGGEDQEMAATRIVVPLCLEPEAYDLTVGTQTKRSGMAATAVVATGMGTSLMSRSAYERLKPLLSATETPSTLYLPSGPESVTTITINRLAIVSNETLDLGPCGELAKRRRLLVAKESDIDPTDLEDDGAAVAELNVPQTFAIIDDESPYLQALIAELRPSVADIDVIIGGSTLANFFVNVDYPEGRVVLRCDCTEQLAACNALPNESCVVLPYCTTDVNSPAYCLKEKSATTSDGVGASTP